MRKRKNENNDNSNLSKVSPKKEVLPSVSPNEVNNPPKKTLPIRPITRTVFDREIEKRIQYKNKEKEEEEGKA